MGPVHAYVCLLALLAPCIGLFPPNTSRWVRFALYGANYLSQSATFPWAFELYLHRQLFLLFTHARSYRTLSAAPVWHAMVVAALCSQCRLSVSATGVHTPFVGRRHRPVHTAVRLRPARWVRRRDAAYHLPPIPLLSSPDETHTDPTLMACSNNHFLYSLRYKIVNF